MKAYKFYLDETMYKKLQKILRSRGNTFSWWVREKIKEEINEKD